MIEKTVLSLSYGRIIVKPKEKLHGLVPESFETFQIDDPGNIFVRTTDLQSDKNSLRIGHTKHRGIITAACMCLETTGRVSNDFGYQVLNTYDLLKIIYGYGSGLRQNLDFSHIKRMPVAVPPLLEQAAIFRFLAPMDRRIRCFIGAAQKLIKLLEEQKQAIREKAEIMVDHFHNQVLVKRKIGGQARAMVITSGIERAIQYFHAFREYLKETKSPYQAIVAFSGEHEYGGRKVTEASLNGFPSNQIVEKIREDPYHYLICADKFQTGYDEPLMHTMYVDKPLSGIKAVQTLSRLNRAHPKKHDTFVLDFQNDVDTIRLAFEDYYRTTILPRWLPTGLIRTR